MEKLTIDIDCTDRSCKGCNFVCTNEDEQPFCKVFDLILKRPNWKSYYDRLPECIAACKAQKEGV